MWVGPDAAAAGCGRRSRSRSRSGGEDAAPVAGAAGLGEADRASSASRRNMAMGAPDREDVGGGRRARASPSLAVYPMRGASRQGARDHRQSPANGAIVTMAVYGDRSEMSAATPRGGRAPRAIARGADVTLWCRGGLE